MITRANEILSSLEGMDDNKKSLGTVLAAKEFGISEASSDKEFVKEKVREPEYKAVTVPQPLAKPSYPFFDTKPVETKKSSLQGKEKRVVEKIKELDILDMTPMQAMNILYELHKKLK